MKAPDTHLEYLKKKDFHPGVSLETFSQDEISILHRYGYWMQALANCRIEPMTDAQRQFLAVCQGTKEPSTPHESAWWKFRQRAKFEADGWNYDPRYRQATANETTFGHDGDWWSKER